MKRCPITYEVITNEEMYSKRGLHLLSPQLKNLQRLNLTAEEQRIAAVTLMGKMSIQGVQTKLSAQLKVKDACFQIVEQFGHYILKPQSEYYPELPENEAITMTLAGMAGIEVPIHGLIYAKDNSMTYFIKRFDRTGHKKKYATEDFSQLSGLDRHTKYESSMENIIKVIANFCTFPKIEFVKLLKLTLFNFLVGNEDMHLKNFSLITREKLITLSPAYDLLNSSIAIGRASEELALPLNGKKKNLRKQDFIDYYAIERMGLNDQVIKEVMEDIQRAMPKWKTFIQHSFLSEEMKKRYIALLEERYQRLQ